MPPNRIDIAAEARARSYAVPIDDLDPAQPALFAINQMWWNFERLRKEDSVHLSEGGEFGRYWSITKLNDIMAVDTDHRTFSSEARITLVRTADKALDNEFRDMTMFIAM